MKAEVFPANLRDLSYVASNLRSHDRHEIDCQSAWWSPALIAHGAMRGFAYVVWLDHNPEAAFGAAEERPGLWHAWSWGSVRMPRCVPAITRHFYSTLGPAVAEAGAWRVEARALASNELALRWLRKLSAVERCVLPRYGKNGEDFILFDWTRESWADVLLQATRTEAAADAASG